MNIQITMVDVEDGDAIILLLKDDGNQFVVLIDAGRKQYAEKVISKLDGDTGQSRQAKP